MSKLDREQIAELLSAYVDGETDPRETEFVEHLLQKDDSLRQDLAALRSAIEMVGQLPRHASPPAVAEDIRNRIEREALLGAPGELPTSTSQKGPTRGAWLSMAAMIGLVAIAGVWVLRDREVVEPAGQRLAQADRAAPAPGRSIGEAEKPQPAPATEVLSTEALTPRKTASTKRPGTHENRETAKTSYAARRERKPDRENTRDAATAEAGGPSLRAKTEDSTKFEEKLAKGADDSVLRTHRFVNEPLALRIGVADESKRDLALDALQRLMAQRNVAALGGRQVQATRTPGKTEEVYYQGVPGVNYDGTGTQILVRMGSRDLPALLDELAQITESHDVSLVAGPLVFAGLSKTRNTLREAAENMGTREPAEPVARQPGSKDEIGAARSNEAAVEAEPAVSPPVSELLELFGVNPEWIRMAAAAQDPKSNEERPTLVQRSLESMQPEEAAKHVAEGPEPQSAEHSDAARTDQGVAAQTPHSGSEERPDHYVTLVIEIFVPGEDDARVRPTRSGIKKDSRAEDRIRRPQK